MNFKTLSLLLLSATALAAPDAIEKRDQNSELTELHDELSSFLATQTLVPGFTQAPPISILSVLETAVPVSVLQNPQPFYSEVMAGSTPGWVKSLPSNVKDYFSSVVDNVEQAEKTATAAGGDGSDVTAAATPAATTKAGGESESQSTATATSSNAGVAAPAATGAVTMGIAGAVGVLGLAIAL